MTFAQDSRVQRALLLAIADYDPLPTISTVANDIPRLSAALGRAGFDPHDIELAGAIVGEKQSRELTTSRLRTAICDFFEARYQWRRPADLLLGSRDRSGWAPLFCFRRTTTGGGQALRKRSCQTGGCLNRHALPRPSLFWSFRVPVGRASISSLLDQSLHPIQCLTKTSH